jgi:hypothetical protein
MGFPHGPTDYFPQENRQFNDLFGNGRVMVRGLYDRPYCFMFRVAQLRQFLPVVPTSQEEYMAVSDWLSPVNFKLNDSRVAGVGMHGAVMAVGTDPQGEPLRCPPLSGYVFVPVWTKSFGNFFMPGLAYDGLYFQLDGGRKLWDIIYPSR